jgi:hypothetical protein
MNTIHLILQGKGGVGKSLVASLLMQYLREKELAILGIDTDPVNSTLAGYKGMPVKLLELLDGGDIDPRRFDLLVETVMALDNHHVIVDNGASSFIPLCSYLAGSGAIDLLEQHGHTVYLHTVITGGQAMSDTANGLASLCRNFETPIIVWLNSYAGEIAMQAQQFEDFSVYQGNIQRIKAVIKIPLFNRDTFGRDLEELFSRRETFKAAIDSSLPIMTRQRLTMFWRAMMEELDKTHLAQD